MGAARRSSMPPQSGSGPILMTTAAMVVAMVPLLIAAGAGAASRFDIGVVIAAGMTIGTLFTLFVTPAVYTYLARDHQKVRTGAEAAEAVAAPSARQVRDARRGRCRGGSRACCSRRARGRIDEGRFRRKRSAIELSGRPSLWPGP